jgi:hypothetical protein
VYLDNLVKGENVRNDMVESSTRKRIPALHVRVELERLVHGHLLRQRVEMREIVYATSEVLSEFLILE